MEKFLTLIRFTDKGAAASSDSPQRASKFAQAVEATGGKVNALIWTTGSVDGAVLFEAPDDETAAKLMLDLSAKGFVKTETMRAFDQSEFAKLAGG